MRVFWIGGNRPRHLYVANRVALASGFCGAIFVDFGSGVPAPPEGISELDLRNWSRHFRGRAHAEAFYFSEPARPDCVALDVGFDTLNTEAAVDFVAQAHPDCVLVFGASLIRSPLLTALPEATLNLHLGLSPRYRGGATLFWPFYFLEPPWAGATFHHLVAEPDAGDIVHHTVPPLTMEDGLHDVACKTVLAAADDAVTLLEIFQDKGTWARTRQRGTGKNFLERDFRPEHLRVVYTLFNDDLVAHYLTGRIRCPKPQLVRQF